MERVGCEVLLLDQADRSRRQEGETGQIARSLAGAGRDAAVRHQLPRHGDDAGSVQARPANTAQQATAVAAVVVAVWRCRPTIHRSCGRSSRRRTSGCASWSSSCETPSGARVMRSRIGAPRRRDRPSGQLAPASGHSLLATNIVEDLIHKEHGRVIVVDC